MSASSNKSDTKERLTQISRARKLCTEIIENGKTFHQCTIFSKKLNSNSSSNLLKHMKKVH